MNETLFTIIGYIVFTVYTGGVMGLGVLLEKKTNLDKTICRKIVHILSAFVWVICYFFFGCSVHWVILNGVGALALGIIVFGNLIKTYARDDADKSYGLFFTGFCTFVTALITYLIGEEVYLYTGIAYFCLALGDGFAPIIAKSIKKHNPEIMHGRSLFGTLTVFVASCLSTLIFSYIFNMQLNLLFIFSIASLTCALEFYGLKGLDNLLIECGVFGYLLLYHFGYVTLIFEIVILVTPFLACVAVGSKSLSISGGICSMILFYLVGFFGIGFMPVMFTSILFVVATIVSLITGKLYARENPAQLKQGRTGKQIVAVGFAAIICLVVYYFTDIIFFYALFYLALTEQFADSMASDIGRLSKGKNVDIIRFKAVQKGLSGGISLLGTACALFGSIVLLLVPYLFNVVSLSWFLMMCAIAFVGTLIDSVLGSLFQALYECGVCGVKIETRVHCDVQAKLIKGFAWIDNTAVNLITSFATCAIGCFLLLL